MKLYIVASMIIGCVAQLHAMQNDLIQKGTLKLHNKLDESIIYRIATVINGYDPETQSHLRNNQIDIGDQIKPHATIQVMSVIRFCNKDLWGSVLDFSFKKLSAQKEAKFRVVEPIIQQFGTITIAIDHDTQGDITIAVEK